MLCSVSISSFVMPDTPGPKHAFCNCQIKPSIEYQPKTNLFRIHQNRNIMVKNLISTLLVLAGFLQAIVAYGQIPPPAHMSVLEPMVVIARGRESPASATPGGVASIYSQDIFSKRPVGISEMVPQIPGAYQSSDSLWGSDINIRGLGRNRIVVLIDGCRVNTGTDINAQLGLIDPMDIERIEVLKGPVSALYGSGVLGGVINIITQKGEFVSNPEWHGSFSAGYASNPSGPCIYGNGFYASDANWVYASASRRDYGSYQDGSGQTVVNSQFDDMGAKLQLAHRWNLRNHSEFQIQHYRANEVGIPGTGIAPLPVHSEVSYPDISRTLFNFTHDTNFEASVLKETQLNLFYQRIDRNVRIDHFSDGLMQEIKPEALHETEGLTCRNHFEINAHTLLLGVDIWNWEYEGSRTKRFKNNNIIIDTPLADSSQLSAGIFAEDDWRLAAPVVLNIGLRLDHVSDESDALYKTVVPSGPLVRPSESHRDVNWNVHAGMTWRFFEDWSFTFIGASSHRFPDLLDRYKYIYFASGNELYGNPDLDPERSLFFESGLHYNRSDIRVTAAAFYNRIKDLIIDSSPGGGIRKMENIDDAEIYGAEAELRWKFTTDWSLYGNLAYARGWDIVADDDLAYIPPLNGLTGVRYDPITGFWSSLEVEWAAAQTCVPAGVEPTGGWARVNAVAGYRLDKGSACHDIVFRVDNLFDSDYRNHLSTSRGIELKEPGINISIQWMMEF